MKKFTILNSFSLKVIAMVTMAIDHLGVVFATLWGSYTNPVFYNICRYTGRIAMPLYCFMIVEGVLHTKSYKKYAIRLGIMAALITVVLAVAQYVPSLGLTDLADYGNIFLDLLLGSAMIYCLNHKNKYIKLLALIPLGLSIFSFVAKGLEWSATCIDCGAIGVYHFYPKFLRFQYDWLSLLLMLGYYLSYQGAKLIYSSRGIESETMEGTNEYRITINLLAVFATIFASFFYYSFTYFANNIVFWNAKLQLFAIVSALFIALYNGAKGYSSKWFTYLSYAYYPLHIILIYGICYLIYIL